MSVIDSPSVIPSPASHHLAIVDQLRERLVGGVRRLHAAYGPGLTSLVVGPRTDEWMLGFTPRHLADVPHVMAMGIPEEAAHTILHRLSSYDASASAEVLVVEDGYPLDRPFSFIEMNLA